MRGGEGGKGGGDEEGLLGKKKEDLGSVISREKIYFIRMKKKTMGKDRREEKVGTKKFQFDHYCRNKFESGQSSTKGIKVADYWKGTTEKKTY